MTDIEASWIEWRQLIYQGNVGHACAEEYAAETQGRAVRMYRDRIAERGGSKVAVRHHVGRAARHRTGDPAELDRAGGEPPGPRRIVFGT
ncbi:hypothetical protein [Rhodococcus sp. WAY2]|uniref:hypothetical protein n=1 Tax=Rhodococcus sp. WAY2 TaxID=2663121 RepID=UPI00135CB0BC